MFAILSYIVFMIFAITLTIAVYFSLLKINLI